MAEEKNQNSIKNKNQIITKEKLEKYFEITRKALALAKKSDIKPDKIKLKDARIDFLDMIERYVSDAGYFYKNNNFVLAFAALNYAHGWLDAGARIGLFDVHDSTLFTVD